MLLDCIAFVVAYLLFVLVFVFLFLLEGWWLFAWILT